MSESDRFCIDWLNEYKLTVGDADPTSTEYSLNLGTITNQYQNFYVPAAMKQLDDLHCLHRSQTRDVRLGASDNSIFNSDSDSDSESESITGASLFNVGPVGYPRFCELWRVVFPDLVNRPYRDIMGKCKWCGLIDVGRNQATDAVSCNSIEFLLLTNFTLVLTA
jgi:hypothetical protein